MKKYKNNIIAGILIVIVMVFVFWWGGNAPGLRGWNPAPSETASIAEVNTPIVTIQPEATATEKPTAAPLEKTPSTTKEINQPKTYEDKTDPVPVEPEDMTISKKELTCTLSVRCDSILKNFSWLESEKVEIVPKDGIIFPEQTVVFYDGENVFNLLIREMKRNKIHMEFVNTPVYNSVYIEGIANLYEFDCGELSGWMYKVNDWFPNYGCSRYQLKSGDRVEWVYTCDSGVDVGGNYSAQNAPRDK